MTRKAVLIGLDGAAFAILDHLMAQGVMPFLNSFQDGGVRAELRSVVPPLTPPAWTSLTTGRRPGHHGIFDFFQADSPGSRQVRLATSRDVRCATIWSIANRQGMRTTVLNFPVTFPPPPLDGHVIAGWMPWRQLRLGCHPADLYDRLKALPGFDPRELAMDMELEARATEGCPEDEYAAWVELHTRRERHWLDVLRHLIQTEPSDLTAILFDGPDKIQHLCWRYLDPALWPAQPTALEQKVRERCLDYFRQLDQLLAEVVALAGPEAVIVMASDHGFGPTTEILHINTWLERAGYLTWSPQAAPDAYQPSALGMGHLTRHTHWIDWERTTAYAATPTSNGIHIVQARPDGVHGVPPDKYEGFRRELVHALQRLVDPATGEPIVARVWTREEAFAGPAMHLAPDLTLALRDGGLVSILPSDSALQPRPLPAGAHRRTGIFLAKGPGIRRGMAVRELSILDVAPTLLHSLGLAIPEDLEGRVASAIFEPAYRTTHPVRIAARSEARPDPALAPTGEPTYDEEAQAVMVARLRDLGYLE